jgi:hypothetical protein
MYYTAALSRALTLPLIFWPRLLQTAGPHSLVRNLVLVVQSRLYSGIQIFSAQPSRAPCILESKLLAVPPLLPLSKLTNPLLSGAL